MPLVGTWRTLPAEEVMVMSLTRLLTLGFGAALSIVVGAQGAAGAPAAMHVGVTGKDYAAQVSAKPLPDVQGVLERRFETWGGRVEASDARVAGQYRSTFVTWEYSDGQAHFADIAFALKNAKGSWVSRSIGARSENGSHDIRALAYGQGAYRGLRYVAIFHDRASGSAGTHLLDIDGWIERGTAPATQPVVTDDVHVKITGSSAPAQVLPAMGLRAGVEKTSDPRTSGRYRGTMKLWKYRDGRMHFSGTYALTSDAGSWQGVWHGVVTSDRRYIQFVDALGTGAYKGLRYRHVDKGSYPKSAPKTIKLSVNGWIESVK
jgi:hypothetical protein